VCPSASQLLVLDEADEMLSMNFTEQIYNCYRYLPPDCQVSVSRKGRGGGVLGSHGVGNGDLCFAQTKKALIPVSR